MLQRYLPVLPPFTLCCRVIARYDKICHYRRCWRGKALLAMLLMLLRYYLLKMFITLSAMSIDVALCLLRYATLIAMLPMLALLMPVQRYALRADMFSSRYFDATILLRCYAISCCHVIIITPFRYA